MAHEVKATEDYKNCASALYGLQLYHNLPEIRLGDRGSFSFWQEFHKKTSQRTVVTLTAEGWPQSEGSRALSVSPIDQIISTTIPSPKKEIVDPFEINARALELKSKLKALEASMRAATKFVRSHATDRTDVFFRIAPTQLVLDPQVELQIGVIGSEDSVPVIHSAGGLTHFRGHDVPLKFFGLKQVPRIEPATEYYDEALKAELEAPSHHKKQIPVLKVYWNGRAIELVSGYRRKMDLRDSPTDYPDHQTLATIYMDLETAKAVFANDYGERFSQF